MASKQRSVEIEGRRIRVTNLDKVLYPATGTTKGDVIAYCAAIAPTMIPHCRDRPATRKRWPDGVGEDGGGPSFFQKDLGESWPDWVRTGELQHRDHVNTYPIVDDAATLVWLAQLAALEIHVPQWRFGPDGKPGRPDRLVLDLDPGEGVDLRQCARIAFLVRDVLRGAGLDPVPVTSGSSGIHLYAGLDGKTTSDQASDIAKELARSLEADHPDDITASMKRSLRPGRVFIDWSQNNAAKTTVAPYSLRGRARPFVAAPRTWRELASPHLRQLEFPEVLERVERRGDPLIGLAVGATGHGRGATADRLGTYRSKRNAARTPEPVPAADDDPDGDRAPAVAGARPRFVIQRHDARRLHFDFRLEHDGVLVSWALPKGVPTDPARNRLAVPTEDHPLSYAGFEGEIPRGEYGAGTVRIWDEGEYEPISWTDREIVAELVGRPGGGLEGVRRFALFRTGDVDGRPRWMIHLMRTPAEDGADPAPVPAPDPDPAPDPVHDPAPADGFAPMLSERADPARIDALDADDWAFEMKWDGIRAIAQLDGEEAAIRSRSGASLRTAFPEFAELHRAVNAGSAVLDGEIVALGDDGAPDFGLLQRRLGIEDPRAVERIRREVPAALLVFDVLAIDGRDCRGFAYDQRRELLAELIEEVPGVPVARPESFDGTAAEAMSASRALGLEGLLVKRRASPYRSGARSADWLKFPLIEASEVVVIGWRESEADARGLASVLLAEPDPDPSGGLRYAGRVGTGFSTAERRAIRDRLAPLETEAPSIDVPAEARRGAHWVRPELVAEVRSKGRTSAGAHRQPVWRGWRPDRVPGEFTR